jgi:hypothetical protein
MVTGWKTLPYGKDLRAARDGLQLQGGSWNRSRGENLARFVGGRQAGAHLHVAGDRSKVKGGVGKTRSCLQQHSPNSKFVACTDFGVL